MLAIHDAQCRVARQVEQVLARRGLRARHLPSVELAAASIAGTAGGIAVVDLVHEPMGDGPALQSIQTLAEAGYTVVCHADGVDRWTLGAQCQPLIAGATRVLDSGGDSFPSALDAAIERALAKDRDRSVEQPRLQPIMRALGLEGDSRQMLAVFRALARISGVSDSPVLISGESGTGKELVARAIHRLDPRRRTEPFVAVNCGAISAGLAESELFGHRRGAFTGAERDRKGLIRAADGGVLFLDEVAELELPLQAKLLRVVQQQRVLAVGEEHEVAVDVRVIAATNRDLEERVRQGTFREDLFHRLDVLGIRIPPLRERPEDIAPLVRRIVAGKVRADGMRHPPVAVAESFLSALRHLRLPGNVRQLENIVRQALAAADDAAPLELAHLPPALWRELAARSRGAPTPRAPEPHPERHRETDDANWRATPGTLDPTTMLQAHGWSLARALSYVEGRLVEAALTSSNGNCTRAARLLGVSPRSIYNKIRKHHLARYLR